MPHQCIGCEDTYEDGSEIVLSGCESCGGMTFQYVPANPTSLPDESDDTLNTHPRVNSSSETEHLGGGMISVDGEDDSIESVSQHSSQADGSDSSDFPNDSHTPSHSTPGNMETNQFDLEELRYELNRQFEGIHIVAPGHYELNLMELYRREECIITLHEDGRYAIGTPKDMAFSLDD